MSKHEGPIVQLPENWGDSLLARLSQGQRHGDADKRLINWIERLIRDTREESLHEYNFEEAGEFARKVLKDNEDKFPTEAARRIFTEHVPEWAQLFLEKNRHYGDTANELGTAGQFSDIWRKVRPLKRILWDKEDIPGEGAEEMLKDLIGHCFLTLYFLKKEAEEEEASMNSPVVQGAIKIQNRNRYVPKDDDMFEED